MKRYKKIRPVRFRCPRSRLLAFIRGRIHGRTGGAAAGEDGVVSSGYVQSLQRRYEAYTARAAEAHSAALGPLEQEARQLLFVLSGGRTEITLPAAGTSPGALARAEQRSVRAARRQAEQRSAAAEQLISLRSRILSLEEQYHNRLEHSAKRLEEIFAAYAGGVLRRRAVEMKHVPRVIAATPAGPEAALMEKLEEVTRK